MNKKPVRLGCLISGGGRTVMNLADRIAEGGLNATIAVVISSRADAPGAERAKQRGLPVKVAARKQFKNEGAMHDQITAWLREAGVELVCLCGYLRWVRIDEPFRERVMNIHPALLPSFGGKGMHGEHVHRAVLEAKSAESGCTVHFVDERYDEGPIILQKSCPVLLDDDVTTLAARVFSLECQAYPEAIALFAAGRLRIEGDEVVTSPPGEAR